MEMLPLPGLHFLPCSTNGAESFQRWSFVDVIIHKCRVMWPPLFISLSVWIIRACWWSLNRETDCMFISCSRAPLTVQAQKFQRCLIKIQRLNMNKCDVDPGKWATWGKSPIQAHQPVFTGGVIPSTCVGETWLCCCLRIPGGNVSASAWWGSRTGLLAVENEPSLWSGAVVGGAWRERQPPLICTKCRDVASPPQVQNSKAQQRRHLCSDGCSSSPWRLLIITRRLRGETKPLTMEINVSLMMSCNVKTVPLFFFSFKSDDLLQETHAKLVELLCLDWNCHLSYKNDTSV